MKKKSFLFGLIFLMCLAVPACQSRDLRPAPAYTSICDTSPELGLDYQAAADSFAVAEEAEGLALEALGVEGADNLASELLSGTTFCSLPVSPAAQEVLDQVQQLAADGKLDQARDLLDQLLIPRETSQGSPGKLAEPALNSPRQTMADYLAAAEAEVTSGLGDGQDFLDAARNTFNSFADQQLKAGGLQDMLNLAQESAWLGNEEVMEQALERARKMNQEDIKEALKDFDPCLPNTKQLKQDLTELLKKLQLSMLLGDNSSTALSQGEMIWKKIGQAVQLHFQDEPIADMLGEEYLSDPPACCKDGFFTFQQATFTGYASADIPYTVGTSQEANKVSGSGELTYTEELGLKTYDYQVTVTADGYCVPTPTGTQLELTVTTKGNVKISGGNAAGGWSLDDSHEITLPEQEGASQVIVREGVDYRIFTNHPDLY